MYTKIYWIEQFKNGSAIGIMPRPRGHDWLEDEIRGLKNRSVQTVLCLLEKTEIEELGLKEEAALCRDHGLDFLHFPIPDLGCPTDRQAVRQLVGEVKNRLEQGAKVVIHCRMGIGRSSIIAGAILMEAGSTAQEMLEKISKARQLSVPDTEEQVAWLDKFNQ